MKNKTQKILFVLLASSLLLGCKGNPTNSSNPSTDPSNPSTPLSTPQDDPSSQPAVTPSFQVESEMELKVGESKQITPMEVVGLTTSDFSYTTYDESVASVDSSTGLVTAIGEGETSILIRAKDLRKTVTVKVIDTNKLNEVGFQKLQSIASFAPDDTSIDYTGAPVMNFAWDGGTQESTNRKVDFEGTASNDAMVLRQSTREHSFVNNGDYVIIMSTGDNEELTAANAYDGASATVYAKVQVSSYANAFRLWGWASKSDIEVSLASGQGKFRVVAYEFNEDYSAYTTTVLHASEKGNLTQDEDGWITFHDVSNVADGIIAGAPADNMFVYEVENKDYNLKGKTVILSVEAAELPNTLGEGGKNIASRFGIKRMGFMCDPKPDFSISTTSYEIYSNQTAQIAPTSVGDAVHGTYHYVSSNPDVASVSETGLVTAKEVTERTTVEITVTNSEVNGKEVKVQIVVLPTPDQSFDLEATHEMAMGEQYQIQPTNVVSCDGGFTYESKEKGIATVDANGLVRAVGVGNVSIVVKSGDLKKEMEIHVTSTESILNLSSQEAKDMASFTNTGAFPGAWDFAWSGGVTADKIDTDNSKMDQPLIRMTQTGVGTMNNVAPNDIELISSISGVRSDTVQNSVYVKTDISSSAGSFRLWGRAPTASNDMLGKMKTRIVVYIPNADYTQYQAYVLPMLAVEGFPAEQVKQDNVTGMVTVESDAAAGFMVFSVPQEIRGATGAFVVMESYSIENANHLQTRCYVRRFGFDA